MIQVKCPGCGYIQTLSEERFLAISDDYLSCPHCGQNTPKVWTPAGEDFMPEEAKHKILAFSRRILNGGEINKEIVTTLESQVRRYGSTPESLKALGVGYAEVREYKRAEEFLIEAGRDNTKDPEILSPLLKALLKLENFSDAVQLGEEFIFCSGVEPGAADIANLAMAYIEIGRIGQAKELLENFPELNQQDSAVKMVRKRLNKLSRRGFADFLKQNATLGRVLGAPQEIKDAELIEPICDSSVGIPRPVDKQPEKPTTPAPVLPTPNLEYWIYALDKHIPQWENIRDGLLQINLNKSERARMFRFLESSIQDAELSIDYILRDDAPDLFNYPEDIIPTISRNLEIDEKENLINSQMIVRVRFSPKGELSLNEIFHIQRLVEAIRNVKSGIVQDAVSHILWGGAAWKSAAENPAQDFVDSHVHYDILDEGESLWVHTHGMIKFGLPELELDEVSADSAIAAKRLLAKLSRRLIESKGSELPATLALTGSKFVFNLIPQDADPEGHFPQGSVRINAQTDKPEASPEPAPKPLTAEKSHVGSGRKSAPEAGGASKPLNLNLAKAKLLNAHKKAKEDIALFKHSFHTREDTTHIHAVKIGFPCLEGEQEWMWVSLESWRGESISGYLENMPTIRRDLRRGSRVQIDEKDIFDWVIARNGCIEKGAYTENAMNH